MSKIIPDAVRQTVEADPVLVSRQHINQARRVEKVESFKTTDGRTFEREHEAKVHGAELGIAKLVEETRIGCGGPCDSGMVLDFLLEHASVLGPLLTEYGYGPILSR
jgi:hypothetical protein